MRFKNIPFIATTLLSLSLLTSCGVLGEKEKPNLKSDVGNTGCLNNSKDLMKRYVNGEIDQTEWKDAFDCIDESLGFFSDYVRGSNENYYTQSDMYTLITKFIFTNKSVERNLMRGAFGLKSALFGGNSFEFRKDEFELLRTSLVRLKEITSDLIPYLKSGKRPGASYAEILEMTSAFKRAGEQLGDFVSTLPTGYLSEQSLEVLIQELTRTLDLPVIEDLSGKIFLAKWLMFNSRRDALEQADWPQFFKTAMGVAGISLSLTTGLGEPNQDGKHNIPARFKNDYRFREFLWALVLELKPYIDQSIVRHGGVTPFPLFDHVIDQIPEDMLGKIKAPTLKQAIRPIMRKLLLSDSQMGVDQKVVDTTYSLMNSIIQDLGLMDRFYEDSKIQRYSTSPADMQAAMDQFSAKLPTSEQRARFNAIRRVIMTYKPMFFENSWSIKFDFNVNYSHDQAFTTVLLNPVVDHVLATYGDGTGQFSEANIVSIFKDYTQLLFEVRFVDPTVLNFGAKRLQDMDIFTQSGDGNGRGSKEELIYYAMTIISSSTLTTQVRKEIVPLCKGDYGLDIMDWDLIPAGCFRKHFHERLAYWLNDFPRLKAYWETLSPDEKVQAMVWLEHGARKNGYSDDLLGKYDFGAFVSVLHYTETLFTRYDTNDTEILGKSEIYAAYPAFKALIKKQAKKAGLNSDSDWFLKGLFTYIVRYQVMPELGNIAKIAWWLVRYNWRTTQLSTDRLGVFNIVCQLAAPETPQQQELTKSICRP